MKKQDIDFLSIPDTAGVYYFWDIPIDNKSNILSIDRERKDKEINNHILYIGKATSLRNRIKSYFDDDLIDTRGLKLVNMVLAANSVTYEMTDNVMEALLLENILIKKYQPYYNSKEKDNKSYTCVVITDEEYPRLLSMRIREYEKRFMASNIKNNKNINKDNNGEDKDSFNKAKVYGPFTSAKDIRETLKIIRKIFPFRDHCEVAMGKPCFNAQIGLCPGFCETKNKENIIDKIEKEKSIMYKENIKNIKYLFEGKSKKLLDKLKLEMNKYAKDHKFELAATRRDSIYRLKHINDIALINNDDINEWKDKKYRIEAYDIAHISGTYRVGVMTVIEGGKRVPSEYRKFTLTDNVNDDYEGIRDIIERRMRHTEWRMPDLIVWDGGIGQKNAGDKALLNIKNKKEISIIDTYNIQTVAVVKDNRHKAKEIIGAIMVDGKLSKIEKERLEKAILLANSEAHRYSIKWHREKRDIIEKENKIK